MSKSLKYQVVKLAKENPFLRGHLLPLVTGKTANDDGLRLALTKLAYENPSLRSAVLPLVKTSGNDKVKMMNENGRVVWVSKKTLQGPKGKNYKPIKEDKSKGNMSVKEWTAEVEKTKERISSVEKGLADLKEATEEQQKKTDEAKEKYESTRDELWSMQNSEWNAYGKIENSDKAEELIKMVSDLGGMYEDMAVDWSTMRNYAATAESDNPKKDADKVKKALDEYLNSKFVKDLYASFPSADELSAKKSEVEELEEVYTDEWNGLRSMNEGIEDYNEALDKQKKKLSELESNKPKKEQGGGGKKKEKPAEETSEKSEKSEPKPLTKAEMKKKYEESIKNSDMSADEKKKALERAKDPNFDVEGALAGMSDDEEEVKTSSLKYELVRLAHQNPKLRKHILPLLK